ncbi:tol-pal system-associated acyl-CoA thioesterase [Roseivivax sediminis]|uniref:Acyl-CoA thioester hydrolase n=1 Tax=Roseivivax sediminis TaxID=936889 RepID=A0A1I1USP9_9RHOB|nr:tol-pal system-associated acyl-CoA thioesterase [Roseivivax sediminis]SFD73734.1 acyl-CoA thioester hydrolase [Roseivivax sediminis]
MPHEFAVTVYYEDTDMGGIVYHANYLKYIERARSAWVRELGIDQNAMREAGTAFVVRRVEADYLGAARLDDELTVRTRTESVTGARLVMAQEILREGKVIFRAEVTAVCATLDGQPVRLPAEIRQKVN